MNIRSISELTQYTGNNTIDNLVLIDSKIEISRRDNNVYVSENISLTELLTSINNKMDNLSIDLINRMDDLSAAVVATENRMSISVDNLREYLIGYINDEMKKYLPLSGGTLSGPGNLTVNGSTKLNNTNIPTGVLTCGKVIEGIARKAMWA